MHHSKELLYGQLWDAQGPVPTCLPAVAPSVKSINLTLLTSQFGAQLWLTNRIGPNIKSSSFFLVEAKTLKSLVPSSKQSSSIGAQNPSRKVTVSPLVLNLNVNMFILSCIATPRRFEILLRADYWHIFNNLCMNFVDQRHARKELVFSFGYDRAFQVR